MHVEDERRERPTRHPSTNLPNPRHPSAILPDPRYPSASLQNPHATPSPVSTPLRHSSTRKHPSARSVRPVRFLPTRSPGLTRLTPSPDPLKKMKSDKRKRESPEKEKKNPNYLLNRCLQATDGGSDNLSSDVSLSAASPLLYSIHRGSIWERKK